MVEVAARPEIIFSKFRTRSEIMASFWCLYCWLWTYFTPRSSIYIGNFDQVNASREKISQMTIGQDYKFLGYFKGMSVSRYCGLIKKAEHMQILIDIKNRQINITLIALQGFLYFYNRNMKS